MSARDPLTEAAARVDRQIMRRLEAEERAELELLLRESGGGAEATLTEYEAGYLAGLAAYAWYKDGATLVGTTGTTLAQAKRRYLDACGYTAEQTAELVPETPYERWFGGRAAT